MKRSVSKNQLKIEYREAQKSHGFDGSFEEFKALRGTLQRPKFKPSQVERNFTEQDIHEVPERLRDAVIFAVTNPNTEASPEVLERTKEVLIDRYSLVLQDEIVEEDATHPYFRLSHADLFTHLQVSTINLYREFLVTIEKEGHTLKNGHFINILRRASICSTTFDIRNKAAVLEDFDYDKYQMQSNPELIMSMWMLIYSHLDFPEEIKSTLAPILRLFTEHALGYGVDMKQFNLIARDMFRSTGLSDMEIVGYINAFMSVLEFVSGFLDRYSYNWVFDLYANILTNWGLGIRAGLVFMEEES